jgi:hypothetical protein
MTGGAVGPEAIQYSRIEAIEETASAADRGARGADGVL